MAGPGPGTVAGLAAVAPETVVEADLGTVAAVAPETAVVGMGEPLLETAVELEEADLETEVAQRPAVAGYLLLPAVGPVAVASLQTGPCLGVEDTPGPLPAVA